MFRRTHLRPMAATLIAVLSATMMLVAGPAAAATPTVVLTTVSPNPVAPGDVITLAATVTDSAPPAGYKVIFCFTDPRFTTCDVQQNNTLAETKVNDSGVASGTSFIPLPGIYDVYATYYGRDVNGIGTVVDSNHMALVVGTAPTLPTLSIGDVSVREGNTRFGNLAILPVTLSTAATTTVTATALTTDGTARTGSDYVSVPFPVRIAPGRTTAYVLVLILGDRIKEPNETFTVSLTNITGAVAGHNPATGTILDDD